MGPQVVEAPASARMETQGNPLQACSPRARVWLESDGAAPSRALVEKEARKPLVLRDMRAAGWLSAAGGGGEFMDGLGWVCHL